MQVLSVLEEMIKYAAMAFAIVLMVQRRVRQISHYLEKRVVTVKILAHVQALHVREHSK
jgi:hypothetical protein